MPGGKPSTEVEAGLTCVSVAGSGNTDAGVPVDPASAATEVSGAPTADAVAVSLIRDAVTVPRSVAVVVGLAGFVRLVPGFVAVDSRGGLSVVADESVTVAVT
jgi:hypothetical protein